MEFMRIPDGAADNLGQRKWRHWLKSASRVKQKFPFLVIFLKENNFLTSFLMSSFNSTLIGKCVNG